MVERYGFMKRMVSSSESLADLKVYDFPTLVSWVDAHFPPSDVKGPHISHTDLVAERVLSTAVIDFPDDPGPTQALTERQLARGDLEAALAVNAARFAAVPTDKLAFIALLKILLMSGRLKEAKQVFQDAAPEIAEAAKEETAARDLLIAMIDGGGFDDEALDFEDVFFAPAFVQNISSITEIARLFSDRYQFEYLDRAKTYIESSGGTLVYVSLDNLFDVQNKSATEAHLLGSALWSEPGKRLTWLKSKPPHVVEHYGDLPGYSDAYLDQVFGGPNHILQATKVGLHDFEAEFVNVVGNKRCTTGVPQAAGRRVLVLGGSDVYGFGADDERTIPSFLQKMLNEAEPTGFRVENHGLRGNPLPVCMTNLFQTQIQPGDVVILFGYPKLIEKPSFLEDLECHHMDFSRPHDLGEVFIDHSHVGPRGNEFIAGKLVDIVRQQPAGAPAAESEETPAPPSIDFIKYLIYRNSADTVESTGLKDYVEYVTKIGAERSGLCGSVAVNCNPMTLGHLHLLEYAASKVDHLYVFVIEEDLSFFAFKHRLEMVEKGLAHLPNVTVLRGGRYICTQLTYPEYFSKEDVSEVKADASMEAWFFSEYIAKAMGISIIFLGHEPTCNVTRQYNAKMSDILPKYGITVDIIPRISSPRGDIISASSVRRLLAARDFDGIREIVPEATYRVLKEHYTPSEAV